jgi:hypothetical protein
MQRVHKVVCTVFHEWEVRNLRRFNDFFCRLIVA